MLEVLVGLGVFAVVIATGWALVRFGAVPAGSDTVLTRVCFYSVTPALLITTVAGADLSALLSHDTLAGLAAELVGVMSAWLLHRLLLRRTIAASTIGALAAGYVNAANLGIPVLILLLGSAEAIAPILLLQLLVLSPVAFAILDWCQVHRQGLATRTLGRACSPVTAQSGADALPDSGESAWPGHGAGCAHGGGEVARRAGGATSERSQPMSVVRRQRVRAWTAPARNPLLLGVMVGLVVNLAGWDMSGWLAGLVPGALHSLGSMAVTLMMLALGMSLAGSSPKVTRRLTIAQVTRLQQPDGSTRTLTLPPRGGQGEEFNDVSEHGLVLWVTAAWKLLMVPLMAVGIGLALGLHGPALLTPVTTAALPSAQNVFMYATRYGVAKPLARDCVLITTAGFVPVVLLARAVLGG